MKFVPVLHVDKLKNQVIYLAAPYSHSDPAVVERRMDVVARVMAELMQSGVCVVSPLSFHWVGQNIRHPLDWKHFENYCMTLLSHCDAVVVVYLEGWQTSEGVTAELAQARTTGKPCYVIDYISLKISKM